MYDLVLRGGTIVDGSGAPAYQADVAIQGRHIAAISPNITDSTSQTVDVSGLVVSPGFIDFHTHSDTAFLLDERCQSKIYQGVTSEVAGQCGETPFPVRPQDMPPSEITPFYSNSMAEYIEKCRTAGKYMATNLILLTGHGALRTFVCGPDDRPATPDELERMQAILEADMQVGGWGLSLGLGYAPGASADQRELDALGQIVARYGGIMTSHMRNQSERTPEALEEMFNVYRHSGAQVHIAHFKAYDRPNWGRAPEFTKILHDAQAEGIPVSADIYPYHAAASGITNIWPNWAILGGRMAAVGRATPGDADYPRLLAELEAIFATPEDGDALYVVDTGGRMPLADGKTMRQIAEEMGLSMAQAQLEVTRQTEALANCILFGMSEQDVLHFMAQPDFPIGSDGSGMSLDAARVAGKPHPRNFGTFPRFLRLCREHQLCSLETAVHRITGRCAQLIKLPGRGLLKAGYMADITVFNPDTVTDYATFEAPIQANGGIEHVLMSGRFALQNGEQTRLRGGQFLAKNARQTLEDAQD